VRLPDPLWRTLAIRYGIYFLLVAGLNEAVWRTQPEEVWVLFRMPGLQLLSLAFSATQFPLMMRGAKAMEAADAEEAGRVRGAGEARSGRVRVGIAKGGKLSRWRLSRQCSRAQRTVVKASAFHGIRSQVNSATSRLSMPGRTVSGFSSRARNMICTWLIRGTS
jgi:hypothetical protein